MNKLDLNDVTKYVEDNIGTFHQKRIETLVNLKFRQILSRENPYLLKTKYGLISSKLVKDIVDAHIFLSEENVFDHLLKGLAIFINEKVYAGKKSSAQGIDLEFDKEGKRYLVSIKSGPNWGNSSQIKKLVKFNSEAKKE